MELWRLVAHRHWFTLRAFGRELRVCARCSGYAAGFVSLTALGMFREIPIFNYLPAQYQLSLCLFLITPFTYDFLTHAFGLRESNNNLRFLTGAILGSSVYLFSLIRILNDFKTLLYLSTALLIVTAYLISLTKYEKL